MVARASLLPELEEAIQRGSAERRAETLARITELFLAGADRLSDEQVRLFDDVFARLIVEIETRALAELSRRLAPVGNAPVGVVRRLAQDDDIAVAGPVLRQSPRLDQTDLLALARTKSQAHLLAISGRREIDQPVTDVLVRRGDREVVRGVAGNAAARLSETAFAALVRRAGQDGVLAEQVGRRSDIPPHLFQRLVIQATAVVQARLLATATPAARAQIKQVLARIADEVGAATPRRDYTAAQQRVADLARNGKLGESELGAFARAGEFEVTVAALAALCEVPIEIVDRLVTGGKPDPVLVLCKAMQYRWATVAAVMSLRLMAGSPSLERACEQFERLSASTAQRVLHFWRARPSGAGASAAASLST